MALQFDEYEKIKVSWQPPGGVSAVAFYADPLGIVEATAFSQEHARTGKLDDTVTVEFVSKQVDLVIRKVTSWEGIERNHAPLPCTDDNKRAVFDRFPLATAAVFTALFSTQDLDERRKGSEDGSGSGTPIPGSIAGSTTPTVPSA